MDLVASQLIDVAISTLRQHVVTDLRTDAGRIYADLLTRVLRLVSARLSIQEETLQSLRDECGALSESAPVRTTQDITTPSFVVRPSGNEPLESALSEAYTAEAAVAALIPPVVANASAAAVDRDALDWLTRMVASQERYYTALDPDVRKGSQVAYRGGRIDEEVEAEVPTGAQIDRDTVTAYLRSRTGDDDLSIATFDKIPGGFSKTTYLVELEQGSLNGSSGIVIRQDPLVPYNCKTIVEEYDLLRRLYAHGYPIAEPLLLEEDRTILGSPFAISKRMSGSGNVHEWAERAGSIEPFARMLAEALARLHTIPLSGLGYSPSVSAMTAGDHMIAEITKWEELFAQKQRKPYPMNTFLLSWLKQNVPPRSFQKPASVIHGDVGFHNLLVNEGELSCILDWEYSHFGDPVEDMIFAKPFIENWFDWDKFKRFYYDAGGSEITLEDESYYAIWPGARNSISCVDAVSVVETALPDELKYIVSGYILMPYVQIDACKAVLGQLATARP